MTTTPPRSSAAPVLRLSLLYGAALFAAIAVVGSVVGALVSELPGLLSALIGAGMGFLLRRFCSKASRAGLKSKRLVSFGFLARYSLAAI